MKGAFPNIVLGFSDHTQGPLASSLAVGLGAVFFEKHFTLSHDLSGPDHWFSEDPEGLKEWVDSIRKSYEMLGSYILRPSASEIDMRKIARRSIVAKTEIKKGEKLTTDNLTLRRPGIGIKPKYLSDLISRVSTRDIKQYELLEYGDFI